MVPSVLIVDDEKHTREGLQQALSENYDVTLAANADEAFNLVETQPFDVMGFYPGIPTASAKVLRVPIARAVTFAANFANSVGKASANATGSTAFDIQKNGSKQKRKSGSY